MAANIVGEVTAVCPKFMWEIDNFCMCCKNVGDFLRSPTFTIMSGNRNIECFMRLFPRGTKEEYKDSLSLFLYHVGPQITADITFEILDDKGDSAYTLTMTDKSFKNSCWGYKDFIDRKTFLNLENDFLNTNKLTIACTCKITSCHSEEMEVDKESTSEQEAEKILHRLAAIDKYETLINDDKFSDVSLVSEGKSIKAHKCILAKSSPVFATMFDTDMKEKLSNTVEITDIAYDILMELIRFTYTGKVDNIDKIACELAAAADKYAMDELKELCEKTICNNLSIDNTLLYLELADRYYMGNLKKKAIEFLVTYPDDITNQVDFNLLPSNLFGEICRALILKIK